MVILFYRSWSVCSGIRVCSAVMSLYLISPAVKTVTAVTVNPIFIHSAVGTRGFFSNCWIHTKRGLKEAYTTSHTKVVYNM